MIRKCKLQGLKKSWLLTHQGIVNELRETLKVVPLTEGEGKSLGRIVQGLQEGRDSLEKGLEELNHAEWYEMNQWGEAKSRLCALGNCETVVGEKEKPENHETPSQKKPDVLQTVTMSLSDVRQNLSDWVAPMKDEYDSLVHATQAVTPVHVDQLDPDKVEFVPGKLVCVVKAGPNGGKKKCRGVICGNMMEDDPSPIGVYASGADGTLIRSVLRHSVLKEWGCTITDIKTAFLLAPRIAAPNQREVVVVPPKVLMDAGVCPTTERWVVRKALYGLPSIVQLAGRCTGAIP